jgi:hypothetical protein
MQPFRHLKLLFLSVIMSFTSQVSGSGACGGVILLATARKLFTSCCCVPAAAAAPTAAEKNSLGFPLFSTATLSFQTRKKSVAG